MTREEAIKRLKEARSTIQPYRYVDEAIDYAVTTLEQEAKWIPVSERLPKKDGQYLITTTNGDIARYVFNKNGNSLEYWMRCAIAWMSLPKPYEPQESEE